MFFQSNLARGFTAVICVSFVLFFSDLQRSGVQRLLGSRLDHKTTVRSSRHASLTPHACSYRESCLLRIFEVQSQALIDLIKRNSGQEEIISDLLYFLKAVALLHESVPSKSPTSIIPNVTHMTHKHKHKWPDRKSPYNYVRVKTHLPKGIRLSAQFGTTAERDISIDRVQMRATFTGK